MIRRDLRRTTMGDDILFRDVDPLLRDVLLLRDLLLLREYDLG